LNDTDSLTDLITAIACSLYMLRLTLFAWVTKGEDSKLTGHVH